MGEKKKKFFSFKKKTQIKVPDVELEEPQGSFDTEVESKSSESMENEITVQSSQDKDRDISAKVSITKESEPELEDPQDSYDTHVESKSSESIENKITVQASQKEMRDNIEPEPQPVVLSANSSSDSPSAVSVPPADSEDRDMSTKESTTKESELEPEEAQGSYDTKVESELSESTENKIAVMASQVRENVESEPQPVVISISASSASTSVSAPPTDLEDRVSTEESIVKESESELEEAHDTEVESKSLESIENKRTIQASQDEVCKNVESEPKVVVLSAGSSSTSPSVSLPPDSEDKDMSTKESKMSLNRNMEYSKPHHDIPAPLPDEKKDIYEESVEDVVPVPPKLGDVTFTMVKPLTLRSNVAKDDLILRRHSQ